MWGGWPFPGDKYARGDTPTLKQEEIRMMYHICSLAISRFVAAITIPAVAVLSVRHHSATLLMARIPVIMTTFDTETSERGLYVLYSGSKCSAIVKTLWEQKERGITHGNSTDHSN